MSQIITWQPSETGVFQPDLPHFEKQEFVCKCGHPHIQRINIMLIKRLEELRNRIGLPIHITSGFRCPDYNHQVGGEINSQHLDGLAADIQIHGFLPYEYRKYYPELVMCGFSGIGIGCTFWHVDCRMNPPMPPGRAYWEYDEKGRVIK